VKKKEEEAKKNQQTKKKHAHAASVFTHPPHADIITKKHTTQLSTACWPIR
jgi:hypothetical protein